MSRNPQKMPNNGKPSDFEDRKDGRNTRKKPNNKRSRNRRAELSKGSRDNDPNWYFTSSDLAEQCSQLSFQSILGYSDPLGAKIPSIYRIDDVMSPGNTYPVNKARMGGEIGTISGLSTTIVFPGEGKAGVNLMADKLYTTLSSFTGRTASYAPQDVAMMILAISSIAEISETIRRAFGIALTYNFRNRAIPLGLLESMGLDVDDFTANISIYRMRFNVALSRINQIPLLENIAFIKKSRDLYQRIYVDKPVNMAQVFYHMPHYFFTLDEQGDSDGSVLVAEEFSTLPTPVAFLNTMATWLKHLEDMITAALESSTLNFIYADLLNMANKLNVPTWQFDYLAENYVVMPEYNANAILQMHNMTITGIPQSPVDSSGNPLPKLQVTVNNSTFYVTGASISCSAARNEIVYNPMFNQDLIPLKWIIDMPTDNPSIEDRIEALRYTTLHTGNVLKSTNTANLPMSIFCALPDHYVCSAYYYTKFDSSRVNTGLGGTRLSSVYAGQNSTVGTVYNYVIEGADTIFLQSGNDYYYLGDLDYWTEVDCAYVARLNQAMSIGLFDFRVK